ncbi:BglG family transcription antiterminator [Clostridium brassicae]|uniref:BglG family transcription antiterminator n=1 Tax=Clostridium brassicae TaxID=2999072 RepID=A0ABT4DFC3_9CLOT|nr:BglG family transcription antiterminator [Clostridium brassicae]MCY6959901.1 BglG family transcription antiterminator [Clostridium brassicae]
MNNEREKAFIDFLFKKKQWIKASVLANHFGVSSRTIRKYVNAINLKYEKKTLIVSSNLGYKLDYYTYMEYGARNSQILDKPQTPDERMYYLLNQMVVHGEGVDLFDLCDILYVSMPTLENDLRKSKAILKSFDLSFHREGDLVILDGVEQNKRKLMSHIFYEESNNKFLNLETIEEFFGYSLGEFKQKMIDILSSYNLYVNEYVIGNILLHIMISTYRIKNHLNIHSESIEVLNNKREYKAAKEIAKFIESVFDVIYDESEIYYLTVLLVGKTTILRQDVLNKENLTEYIEPKQIQLVNDILKEVYENYMVDLYDDQFLIRFMFHIHNLINRAYHNRFSKNPLTQQIKYTYPLIYDLAVFISNYIQKEEHITISEDEIAYIALHIVAFLEPKKSSNKKITVTLIYPEYYNLHKNMIDTINHYFGAQVEIQKVYKTIDIDYKKIDTDLVISTVELNIPLETDLIIVPPFLTEREIDNINNKILNFKRKKEQFYLKKQLIQLFNPHIFYENLYLNDAFEMIRHIGKGMVRYGFVNESYIDDVIEREKMSYTVFNNNVAVPHSMHMNALKSSISIVINHKPVKWGESYVQIIAMIAFNKKERNLFVNIFDNFISIISEPENVEQLIRSTDYNTFINTLASLMG